MKMVICFFTALLFAAAVQAQGFHDAIIGKWLSDNQRCKVEIYKSGDKYYGKIVWLMEQNDPETGRPKTDVENPDESLRNKPLIGLTVLKDFVFKDGYWQEGEVYDSQNGNTYDCKIWLDDMNHLQVKGYWHFVYHVESWTRIE